MSFLTFLDNNENARKIFGKRELVIIRKQLLGVALSQSERNRLSRDIRKKFAFIKSTIPFQDEFRLKRNTAIKQKIQSAKDAILSDKLGSKVKKIVLFGSTAKKDRFLFSDIDISVEFGKINLKEATRFRMRVLGRIDDDIDVQVTEHLPEKIRKDIAEHGKILYAKRRENSRS